MAQRALIVVALVLAAVAGASGALVGGVPGSDDDRGREPAIAGTREATVTRVVDGDTVVLSGLGTSRLIGVDTPEVHGRAECYGRQASAYAKRLLTGRHVRYRLGVEPRDRYRRALVYLTLEDGRLVNELLAAGGYARPLAIAPNTLHADRLRRRTGEARAAGRGLWSVADCR